MSDHFSGSYWLLVISSGVGAPPRLAEAGETDNRTHRIRLTGPACHRQSEGLLPAVGRDQPPVRIARGHVAGERPDIGDIGNRFRAAVDDGPRLVARHRNHLRNEAHGEACDAAAQVGADDFGLLDADELALDLFAALLALA